MTTRWAPPPFSRFDESALEALVGVAEEFIAALHCCYCRTNAACLQSRNMLFLLFCFVTFFYHQRALFFFQLLFVLKKGGLFFPWQLLLEEGLSTGQLSSHVAKFVNMLWCAALSRLTGFISAPVEKLSLNDVSPSLRLRNKKTSQPLLFTCCCDELNSIPVTLAALRQVNRAEGLLLRVHRKLKDGDPTEVRALLDEVSSLLQSPMLKITANLKSVSGTLDLCQVTQNTHREYTNAIQKECF